MKIAVCGEGRAEREEVSEKAKEIGKEIARSKVILLTGGCAGYPYAAVRGAILEGGRVICYSPARDKEEHISHYGFPFEENAEYVFTGKGIPGRNLSLVSDADAVVIVGGKIGTLNEFTIAFVLNKKIGVLEDSGRLSDILREIAAVCDKKGEKRNVYYSANPKDLLRKVL